MHPFPFPPCPVLPWSFVVPQWVSVFQMIIFPEPGVYLWMKGLRDTQREREEAAFFLARCLGRAVRGCGHLEALSLWETLVPLFDFSPVSLLSARVADRFPHAWPLWIIYL